MEYLLLTLLAVTSFFCGWKCGRHWNSRPVPTPLCAEQMRAYRANRVAFYNHVFLSGVLTADRSNLN